VVRHSTSPEKDSPLPGPRVWIHTIWSIHCHRADEMTQKTLWLLLKQPIYHAIGKGGDQHLSMVTCTT